MCKGEKYLTGSFACYKPKFSLNFMLKKWHKDRIPSSFQKSPCQTQVYRLVLCKMNLYSYLKQLLPLP